MCTKSAVFWICKVLIRIDQKIWYYQPFPKRQVLDFSKLKEVADESFKFDENGRKFSKRVEYTVGKGRIARYKQFLFPTVFSKGLYCRHVNTWACLRKG